MVCSGKGKGGTLHLCLSLLFLQEGCERDIVLAILQKSLVPGSSNGILSAFTRDSIHCWVYIEARLLSDVSTVLRGIPGVSRTRDSSYVIHIVELEDRAPILNMSSNGIQPSITEWSWVRVEEGLYKGDLGLVYSVDEAYSICNVLLVPRIALTNDKKRKRDPRPPQALFDPLAIQQTFGARSVEKRNQLLFFKNHFYADGLLHADIPFAQLSSTTILASSQELDFFRRSSYWARVKPFPCHSRVGDRVRVVAGTLQGISGFVVEVKDLTVRFTPNEDHDVVHEVLLTDIRKQFEPGDFVEIIEGLDRGAQGFVIDSDNINASLIIYSRTVSIVHTSRRDVNQIEQQGREVSIPGSLGV
jgi:transcription elongation factor SPT5